MDRHRNRGRLADLRSTSLNLSAYKRPSLPATPEMTRHTLRRDPASDPIDLYRVSTSTKESLKQGRPASENDKRKGHGLSASPSITPLRGRSNLNYIDCVSANESAVPQQYAGCASDSDNELPRSAPARSYARAAHKRSAQRANTERAVESHVALGSPTPALFRAATTRKASGQQPYACHDSDSEYIPPRTSRILFPSVAAQQDPPREVPIVHDSDSDNVQRSQFRTLSRVSLEDCKQYSLDIQNEDSAGKSPKVLYPNIPAPLASEDDLFPTEQPAEWYLHPSRTTDDGIDSASNYAPSGQCFFESVSMVQPQEAEVPIEDVAGPPASSARPMKFEHLHPEHPEHPEESVSSMAHRVLELISTDAFNPRKKADGDWGCVYILEVPEHHGHFKIGSTKCSPNDRRKEQMKCGYDLVLLEPDQCYTKVPCHVRLESLIHNDLWKERCALECPCGIKHDEWFPIDRNDVQRRVQDWRDWMCLAPYAAQGSLKAAWVDRVQKFQRDQKLHQTLTAEAGNREWWKSFRQPIGSEQCMEVEFQRLCIEVERDTQATEEDPDSQLVEPKPDRSTPEASPQKPVPTSQWTLARLHWTDLTFLSVSHVLCLWVSASTCQSLSLCVFLVLSGGYLSLSQVLACAATVPRERLRVCWT